MLSLYRTSFPKRAILMALVVGGLLAIAATPSAAAKFNKIVDTHTLVPDGGGATFSFNNSDVPQIGGDWVVFDTADMTIWRANKR